MGIQEGMETEDLPEKKFWANEDAMQATERFQARDASFLPGHEGHAYSSDSAHEMCRMGRTLMEAAAMGCVPRLRKERMVPMASEIWGQEELLKLMVPCKSKRCCGSDDGSDVHSQEGEEVSCRIHKPYTLHPTTSTLHRQPYTLHPQPSTVNPTPYTLNPQPQTPNPKP